MFWSNVPHVNFITEFIKLLFASNSLLIVFLLFILIQAKVLHANGIIVRILLTYITIIQVFLIIFQLTMVKSFKKFFSFPLFIHAYVNFTIEFLFWT